DGSSMFPTLHDRDKMIVDNFTYIFNEPDRFDIVVFHAIDQKDFIKRVIGLPVEHVKMEDGILYIDGQAVPETFFNSSEVGIDYSIIRDFSLEERNVCYEEILADYV